MRKLVRRIKSIIAIIEIAGAVLSALFIIFEKIGVMKKMHKTDFSQEKSSPPHKENK
jgi:hypothetical protein